MIYIYIPCVCHAPYHSLHVHMTTGSVGLWHSMRPQSIVTIQYVRHAARLDRRSDVQAFNAGSTDAVSTVLRGFDSTGACPCSIGQYAVRLHSMCMSSCSSRSIQPPSGDWRYLGARSQSEARGYYTASMRRAWGCLFVREMARHRLRRVIFVGSGHRPRASVELVSIPE
jgi:hypothetical protein